MRKAVQSISVILCLIITCFFSGCKNGCGIGLRLYENDIFIYTVDYDKGDAYILGLTDLGKEKEYLVIPKEIDGKAVKGVGAGGYDKTRIKEKYGNENYARFNSIKLKKVFIATDITLSFNFHTTVIGECPVLEGFVIIPNAEISSLYRLSGELSTIEKKLYAREVIYAGSLYTTKANVTYIYNFSEAPNDGYYWIDNYKYGEKIEYIPENPMREGYVFEGWYKESDCINKWDFESDLIPKSQVDEQDQEIYQETKLYAKWIKK